jgi:hypothetical protein
LKGKACKFGTQGVLSKAMQLTSNQYDEFKGKRYLRPDGKVITVSHINRIDGVNGDSCFSAFYRIDEPEAGYTGHGSCFLDVLECFTELH